MVPASDQPTHPYIGASPGCWALYGKVLEKEYADYPLYAPVHRLTVDVYAVQHPGTPSRRSIQSVAVHLIRLHLQLERGLPHDKANEAMIQISSRSDPFFWLNPPTSLGHLTVLDVLEAIDPEDHIERVRRWAESAWEAWTPHHEIVRHWASQHFG